MTKMQKIQVDYIMNSDCFGSVTTIKILNLIGLSIEEIADLVVLHKTIVAQVLKNSNKINEEDKKMMKAEEIKTRKELITREITESRCDKINELTESREDGSCPDDWFLIECEKVKRKYDDIFKALHDLVDELVVTQSKLEAIKSFTNREE